YPQGATPLDKNEIAGLIPTHITTRGQLDRWEQENINEALAWIESNKPKDILSESFMKRLHKKMFGHVWKWAGTFRQSEKNIGVGWYMISSELKNLCDDVNYWIKHNGNGRHGRLMADILLETTLNRPIFTWGRANLAQLGDDRKHYIESLRAADNGDYELLLNFVRS
ncbi:MAG: mobile mystery protein B, partial [Planctomycetota bacterium]